MPGRTLAAFDAECGMDEDVHLACHRDGPPGYLGVPGGGAAPPQGRQRCSGAGAAAAACSRSGMCGYPVGGGGRPLALPAPRTNHHLGIANGADDRKPSLASRGGATKLAAALAVSAATPAAWADLLAARSSGSRREVFGTPGAGGEASLSTLTPQGLPGAGSWANLMVGRSNALGQPAVCILRRLFGERGAHALGGPAADLPGCYDVGSGVQTARSGTTGSTSSDVQATKSGGRCGAGSGVHTTRFGGSGSTSGEVHTARSGGSGRTSSDVQTTTSV